MYLRYDVASLQVHLPEPTNTGLELKILEQEAVAKKTTLAGVAAHLGTQEGLREHELLSLTDKIEKVAAIAESLVCLYSLLCVFGWGAAVASYVTMSGVGEVTWCRGGGS